MKKHIHTKNTNPARMKEKQIYGQQIHLCATNKLCLYTKYTFGWKWDGRARDKTKWTKTKSKARKCKQTIVITRIYHSIYKILFDCNI